MPQLALCIRYTDIIDVGKFDQKYRQNGSSEGEGDNVNIQSKITIGDIFRMTPSASESISGCIYRSKDGIQSYLRNSSKCHQIFNIRRFYMIEFICYAFEPRSEFYFPITSAVHQTLIAHDVYGIELGNKLLHMDKVLISIYYGDNPYLSRMYGFSFDRQGVQDYEGIKFRYYWIDNLLLPPPYDTMCVNDSHACLINCYREAEISLNRQFYVNIVDEDDKTGRLDHQHVNRIDLQNQSVRQLVSTTDQSCMERCLDRICQFSYTITFRDTGWSADAENDNSRQKKKQKQQQQQFPRFVLMIRGPQESGYIVKSFEKFPFMSFVIYLFNCFTIWFPGSAWYLAQFISKDPKRVRVAAKLRSRFAAKVTIVTQVQRIAYAERRRRIQLERESNPNAILPWYCGK